MLMLTTVFTDTVLDTTVWDTELTDTDTHTPITVTTTARGPLMLSPRSFLMLVMLVFSEVFTLVCPPPLLSLLRPQLPPSLLPTLLPLLSLTLPQSLLPTPPQLWLSTPPPSSTPPLLSSTSATRSTTRCSTCPRSLSRST